VLLKCGIKELVKKISFCVHQLRDFVHSARMCFSGSPPAISL